jgi:hypothetical protein
MTDEKQDDGPQHRQARLRSLAAWEPLELAKLTLDLIDDNDQLRAERRAAIDAYRRLIREKSL